MAKGDNNVGGGSNQIAFNPSQVGGNFSPPNSQSNSPLAMNPSMGQSSPLMNMSNNPSMGMQPRPIGTQPLPRTNLMPQGPMQQGNPYQVNTGIGGSIDPNLIRQLLIGGMMQ